AFGSFLVLRLLPRTRRHSSSALGLIYGSTCACLCGRVVEHRSCALRCRSALLGLRAAPYFSDPRPPLTIRRFKKRKQRLFCTSAPTVRLGCSIWLLELFVMNPGATIYCMQSYRSLGAD